MHCKERNPLGRVLFVSALMAAGFAFSGLALGLAVDSMAIFFDGVYSAVSLLLTLLSLIIAGYSRKQAGTAASSTAGMLEQLAILGKALMILAVAGYSIYAATLAMLSGGHPVNTAMAVLFEMACACGCAYAWWYMRRHGQRLQSGLINAEMQQWKMDTLLSLVVGGGFMVAWLLERTELAHFASYADPMLMLVMSYYFIKIPAQMIRDAVRSLLDLNATQAPLKAEQPA